MNAWALVFCQKQLGSAWHLVEDTLKTQVLPTTYSEPSAWPRQVDWGQTIGQGHHQALLSSLQSPVSCVHLVHPQHRRNFNFRATLLWVCAVAKANVWQPSSPSGLRSTILMADKQSLIKWIHIVKKGLWSPSQTMICVLPAWHLQALQF